MIYTWENSCNPTDAEYVEEFGYVELIDEEERSMDIQDSESLTSAMGKTKKKVSKPTKPGKGKPKDGPTKSALDKNTEAQIKQQLDDLQLDLD